MTRDAPLDLLGNCPSIGCAPRVPERGARTSSIQGGSLTTSACNPTSTIAAGAPVVTLVNVFTLDPERQDELLELLERATEQVMRHMPGFVSANLHRSLDGTKVANYAQWETVEALEAMLADPTARAHMQEASSIARVEPSAYEVVSVHRAESS